MATIQINIPNNQINRVVNALCSQGGYGGLGSAQDKQEFARQEVIKFIKRTIKESEGFTTTQTALATLDTDINTITID